MTKWKNCIKSFCWAPFRYHFINEILDRGPVGNHTSTQQRKDLGETGAVTAAY